MTGATQRILSHFAALVPPALVLLLLGVQVALGLRGFHRPDESLLYVLQVPGVLLGWGGVALLVPLLAWMIMDWWGYDLRGFALKGLGSAVLGVAFGALVGISGGIPAGGLVGGGLATVLVGTLGTSAAVILMIVMAGPAGVLALSMQRTPAPASTAEPRRSSSTEKRGLLRLPRIRIPLPRLFPRKAERPEPTGTNAWYPERRYDAKGNELPIQFNDARGNDGIRFVEDAPTEDAPTEDAPTEDADEAGPEAEEAVEASTTDDEGDRLPTIPELLSGQFDVARLDAEPDDERVPTAEPEAQVEEEVEAGPLHVDSEGLVIAPVRPAYAPPAPEPPVTFVPIRPPVEASEPPLPPGVRYVDDPVEPEADAEGEAGEDLGAEDVDAGPSSAPAEPVALTQGVQDAVRGPARVAHDSDVSSGPAAMEQTLRERFEAFQASGSNERYLAKLEASGIFDDIGAASEAPPPEEEARTEEEPPAVIEEAAAETPARTDTKSRKRAPRKKSTSKPTARADAGKKAAPKKKAVTKKVATKRAAPKKKAATKRPAAKKKAAARPPKKKAAAKKKATSKPVAKKPATPKKPAAARKKAAARPATKKAATKRTSRSRPGKQAKPPSARGSDRIRKERRDPLFVRAVDAAIERGAATPVLYARRLGLPYDRARMMLDRLVDLGILGEPSATGAHPVRLSQADWDALA